MSSHSSSDDEWDSYEPPQLELNHDKLRSFATNALNIPCIRVERLSRGASHEVFELHFEKPTAHPQNVPKSLERAGYICIARFARIKTADISAKYASEIATIRYLKEHTRLPVPEIYAESLNADNDVGAAFMLMEKLPGRHLYHTWDDLSLEHKKIALDQIAAVVAQLSSTRFDKIGSLTSEGMGPVFSQVLDKPKGPFGNALDYLHSFVDPDDVSTAELAEHYREMRKELAKAVDSTNPAVFGGPFPLIHADLDGQNLLFTDSPDGPRLTGLIDFEYTHTGPLYFLYEYPIFIQDVDWSQELYEENALLRPHFVSAIFERLPDPESKQTFIDCINSRCFALNRFYEAFMFMKCSEPLLLGSAEGWVSDVKEGTGLAYNGRLDYKQEYYTSEGKPMKTEDWEKMQKESRDRLKRKERSCYSRAKRRIADHCTFM